MTPKQTLIKKLNTKFATIGIIGLGYVGLPLSLRYAEAGYKVIGFDIDPSKTKQLNKGKSYIRHFGNEKVQAAVDAGFEATTDFSRATEADALIICVPTPLKEHREPDISFVTNTMDSLLPYLREGQVVSLESTTYPGTTEEELKPRIESTGLKVGNDIFLVYSPEREDPGNPDFTTRTIPKVVGGSTPACLEAGTALYGNVIDQVVPVSSTRIAEMTKLLENIHRAVNIGLVNELKMVCDRMDINIYEVIDAAATKPFGFVPYHPGPGLGGHCIPIDPFYLTWKAKEYGVNTRFIELAGEINHAMPAWVVGKVAEALNNQGKAIKGSRILVLGIAYKKNVDDMRESPSVEIMQQLQSKGALVEYSDPLVPAFPAMRNYSFDLTSVDLSPDSLGRYDCVVIGTNHDEFDYSMIADHAETLVDTRGVYKQAQEHIFPA
jgi:UDP-N-acetyl-D-glucosamine dehydrogenase